MLCRAMLGADEMRFVAFSMNASTAMLAQLVDPRNSEQGMDGDHAASENQLGAFGDERVVEKSSERDH